MLSMFNTEKFIEEVRSQPALWDRSNVQYCCRVERDRGWAVVGEALYEDWHHVNDRERNNRLGEMKNKWRHIRDEYNKQQNNKIKSGVRKRKKYVWSEALSFLQTSTSGQPKVDESLEESQDNDKQIVGFKEEDISVEVDPRELLSNPRITKTETLKILNASTDADQPMEMHSANGAVQEDTDRMFLLSLLPEFKELNSDDKLDFKIMALQFFRDVRQKKMVQSGWTQGLG